MAERKIDVNDASIYRLQAMMEQLLRVNCEIYAHLANKDFKEIYHLVLQEVRSSTEELIKLHSYLGDNPNPIDN